MSANHVDQRSKGQPNQVSNGGKDVMKVEDSYLQQAQQHPVRPWSDQASDAQYAGHGGQQMASGVSDSFFQSFYAPNMTYPFMNQGIGGSEGPWSNGADGMFGMGYDYSSVYSGFGFPYSNWEYAGDYWGNSQAVRKDQRGYPSEDSYYPSPEQMIPPDSYGMMNGAPAPTETQEPIGTVEQGLRNMTLQPSVSSMDSHGRKKMDMSQPPENVMSNSYSSDPSIMMPPPSSSQSVSTSSVLGGSSGSQGASSGQPKKTSWAAIASKPAVPQQQLRPRTIPRAPVNPNKTHNMDIGTWDMRGNPNKAPLPVSQQSSQQPVSRQGFGPSAVARRQQQIQQQHQSAGSSAAISTSINANNSSNSSNNASGSATYSYQGGSSGQGWGVNSSSTTNGEESSARSAPAPSAPVANPVLDKLKISNEYNPKEFNLNPKSARFFIIKSYSEDDIHRSIKYSIWCSTEHGNKRLDQAFREREGKGPVYLIYSVNGSGHFCGISQMMTPVDYNRSAGVWAQDKWKGQFTVKWVYVKDVPNSCLRHIRLENNENKPVTNSRDTQEVPSEKGKQVLRILHSYKHTTSIFDDFHHYEQLQKENVQHERPQSHRDNHRGGDQRGDRGDRGDHRGGDRGDRGDHRGGDRGDHRGGDRGDHRGGDRGDYRGGDRDGGRNRDRRPQN